MERDVATTVAWSKRRYLSRGQRGNFLGFNGTPYSNVLLEDLGVGEAWAAKEMWGVRKPAELSDAWRTTYKKWLELKAKERLVSEKMSHNSIQSESWPYQQPIQHA